MDGKGTLTLSCVEQDDFVQVKIGDTGCGIAEKHMNQIFTPPFFTTKAPGKGTGLGLANCYSIVDKMRGRIRVRSELRKGGRSSLLFFLSTKRARKLSNSPWWRTITG